MIGERSDSRDCSGGCRDDMGRGGRLFSGQTSGGGVIKGGQESGLGGGYVLVILKEGLGDLLGLDVVVDGSEVGQAAGLGEVKGGLELSLSGLDLLSVLEILRSGGGDSHNKHLENDKIMMTLL